ncbi:sensor histidine kinase [Spirillospora albida]|uniref:sensor histidine kinase n=1 Tax=Spirillospora albida TaxID=58123 RepID=UPI000568122B|nr:nitrate- and nitrite sensing domain-containing protein [Spirillospora albida]
MVRGSRSVRTKIVFLLAPPIAALMALWYFAAATTLGDSLRQTRARAFNERVIGPADAVVGALQAERRMSLSFLGDDATIGRSGFDAQRAQTDRARAAFRRAAADPDVRETAGSETLRRMDDLVDVLGDLEVIRRTVDQRRMSRDLALDRYTSLIDGASEIYGEVRSDDPRIMRDSRVLLWMERARENLAREDALVTGALADGRVTAGEHRRLAGFATTREFLYADASRRLPADVRVRYDRILNGPEYWLFRQMEGRLLEAGPTEGRPPVDIGAWHTATEAVNDELAGLSAGMRAATTERIAAEGDAGLYRLALAGGAGLLVVVVAIVVAVRMGRGLIRESRGVAGAVTAFTAGLPAIGEAARRGEPVPEEEPGPPGGGYTVTEIGRIDAAFTEARRAVIRASAGEAAAHRRLNDVFATLARRNQSLLQRLLGMLERMQRRTEDPDELAALFELDHLATRMRRHAEGLVILSGRPSGRTWRHPVRLMDVTRAAASEIEDYTRVEVVPMGRAALSGRAVADTIHLLAELIENAAVYSPPDTPVRVTGEDVPNGFVIEIEDRGLGLPPAELTRLNELLETAPELILDDSAQLGLFVVARLAARHGVRVTLRPSPYGGVTAIVLLPRTLIVDAPAEDGGTGVQPRLAAIPAPADGPPRRDEPEPVRDPEPVTGPEPASTAEPSAVDDGSVLPRRRRQQNLAPQLLDGPSGDARAPDERDPEALRRQLANMRSGWERGRADAAEQGPATPGGE